MTISIITVVYNGAETIERTIRSVISQSYRAVEYIIIDGGSTDATLSIIDKYRNRLAYFVSEPDGGIYDAMNKGIKKATGDVIGLLNADDWYEPEALRTVVEAFEASDADVIYGTVFTVDKNGNKKKFPCGKLDQLFAGMQIPHPAVFVRRNAYEKYGLFDTSFRIVADHELVLRMYTRGARFKAIDTVTTNFMLTGFSSMDPIALELEEQKVFQRYKDLCPYKEAAERELQRRLLSVKYSIVMKQEFSIADDVLHSLIGGNSLAIWGTGAWGKRIAEFCNQGTVAIDFFVDSDKQKQGTTLFGKDIKDPAVLEKYEGIVFIAVRNHDADIAEKLVELGNQSLRLILLQSFIEKLTGCYCYNEIT